MSAVHPEPAEGLDTNGSQELGPERVRKADWPPAAGAALLRV
jgi:hypothetical protein